MDGTNRNLSAQLLISKPAYQVNKKKNFLPKMLNTKAEAEAKVDIDKIFYNSY